MLLEFADRGSLDKAIVTRRFYRRGSVTLDLVSRPEPVSCVSRRPLMATFAWQSKTLLRTAQDITASSCTSCRRCMPARHLQRSVGRWQQHTGPKC